MDNESNYSKDNYFREVHRVYSHPIIRYLNNNKDKPDYFYIAFDGEIIEKETSGYLKLNKDELTDPWTLVKKITTHYLNDNRVEQLLINNR